MGKFSNCVIAKGVRNEVACNVLARTFPEPLEWEGHCVVTSIVDRGECEGPEWPRTLYVWRPPPVGNFDDMGNALLVLFEMATFEQWPTVM